MPKFDLQDLAIDFVPGVASVFWPSFVEYQGLVYLEWSFSKSELAAIRQGKSHGDFDSDIATYVAKAFGDRTGAEAFLSHTHILDLFRRDPEVWSEARSTYKRSHPHFKAAEKVGRTLAEMWFVKLCRDFPGDNFRVYYNRDDNPVVRFHRVYSGEPQWTDVEHGDAMKAFVLDSRPSGRSGLVMDRS